jgi:amino acid transporter
VSVVTPPPPAPAAPEGPATLKPNAIGFLDSLVIGLASTAPAYSLAAVIGSTVVIVGVQAPAALLASFVPMFLIAGAFFYMNRADRDAGTTFSWVTRTLGPYAGWIGGWAVCVTGILVIGSLADVGARYTYLLFGLDGAAGSKAAVMALAIAYIVVLTWICILGTELSARVQNVMILAQVAALLLFAFVALGKVWGGDAGPGALDPSWSWLNPFAIDDRDALLAALLLGVFIYWGWESAVNLCEETSNSRLVPGLSALTSTVVLVITYVLVAFAVVSFAGLDAVAEFDDDESILGALGADVLGSPWDKILVLAIVTSAVASTQTTIIPASRTALSMARRRAYPAVLARIHPRYRTPHVATIVVAALAVVWYVPANAISENFLFDSLSALALMIAFYYALSGVACLVYYRRELTKSAWNLLVMGVGPAVGAFLLGYLFVEATRSLADTGASYSGQEIFGLAPPLAIGYGFLLLGGILLVAWRLHAGGDGYFGSRPFETVDPAVAAGEARGEEPVA